MTTSTPRLCLLVGLVWFVVVVVLGWRSRPRQPRRAERPDQWSNTDANEVPAGPVVPPDELLRTTSVVVRSARLVDGLASGVGRGARRAIGAPSSPTADRRLGMAVLAAVVTAAGALPMAVPVGLAAWSIPWFVARARIRRQEDRVLDELPEAIDLLRLSLGSGSSLRLAVANVSSRCDGTIGRALTRAGQQLDHGASLADALGSLRSLGEPFRPVLEAMVLSERHGAPIVPLLDRIAADVRVARRRRAEELARRVPVKLLFPLVFCTLPAFGLLTVVPLLASALGRFSL